MEVYSIFSTNINVYFISDGDLLKSYTKWFGGGGLDLDDRWNFWQAPKPDGPGSKPVQIQTNPPNTSPARQHELVSVGRKKTQ